MNKELQNYLDYEIRSSWWASWIGWDWAQELAGRYFAWKTVRKYRRYNKSKEMEQKVRQYLIKQIINKN